MSCIEPGVLKQAARSRVLGALTTFASRPAAQWLPVGHPCGNGQLPNNWEAVRKLPEPQIVEVTAATAPQHCVDGWSYAARALSALTNGDHHAARHLAYYAQLRAGLSILANLGVGIFNGINFVITSSGAIVRLDVVKKQRKKSNKNTRGTGTHEVVWDALEQWALDPTLSARFLDLLKVRNIPLRDCLTAIWPSFGSAGAVSNLIEDWGVDLKRGKLERHHRNNSSYAPTGLNPIGIPTIDCLRFVEAVWELFGFHGVSSFDQLDRHLLRQLLQRQHDTVATVGAGNYAQGAIAHAYSNLPPAIQSLAAQSFLTDPAVVTPDLLARARSTANPATAPDMIARAFLLLRVATGFTQTSLVEAGCSVAALRPWLDEIAAARGFWPVAAPLPYTPDLWLDVELGLLDLAAASAPPPVDLHAWLTVPPQGLPVVHQAERIVVWSLAS